MKTTIAILLLLSAQRCLAAPPSRAAEREQQLFPNPFAPSTATFSTFFAEDLVHSGLEIQVRVLAPNDPEGFQWQFIQVATKAGTILAAKRIDGNGVLKSAWTAPVGQKLYVYLKRFDSAPNLHGTNIFEIGPDFSINDGGIYFSPEEVMVEKMRLEKAGRPPVLKGFCLGQ